jgi:hypothetical protein
MSLLEKALEQSDAKKFSNTESHSVKIYKVKQIADKKFMLILHPEGAKTKKAPLFCWDGAIRKYLVDGSFGLDLGDGRDATIDFKERTTDDGTSYANITEITFKISAKDVAENASLMPKGSAFFSL